jgi:hypothetical protein
MERKLITRNLPPNTALEPTPDGVTRLRDSAFAVDIIHLVWLSFGR